MELHEDFDDSHPEKPDRMRVILKNIKSKNIDKNKNLELIEKLEPCP